MNKVIASEVEVLKPFRIEERNYFNNRVSETTVNKWKGCILQIIRKEPKWNALIELNWRPKKITYRGVQPQPIPAVIGPPAIATVPAAEIAIDIGYMLEYILQYTPNSL